MLTATNIHKQTGDKTNPVAILHGIDLMVNGGEMIAIMGPSGCGKSTLLGILSGLDEPTQGSVILNGQSLFTMKPTQRDAFRNRHIGIIFQSHNLVSELTCAENVSLPLVFSHARADGVKRARIDTLLNQVGLSGKHKLYPHQLSGGEQQRASVARALLMQPNILFADEPTGALDQENSRALLRLLRDTVQNTGCAIILVTHDQEVAAHCDRILTMRDGLITGVEAC